MSKRGTIGQTTIGILKANALFQVECPATRFQLGMNSRTSRHQITYTLVILHVDWLHLSKRQKRCKLGDEPAVKA